MKANRKSIEPWIRDDIDYYEHQVDGVRRAAVMKSFLLADEMGLGKSLQSLTVYGIDLYMGMSKTMLVVCPTTLKVNWANEIEKFMGEVRYMILSNKAPDRRQRELAKFAGVDGPKVLIVNYEQVKAHLDEIKAMRFDIALFDEAHMLKNHQAARTKAAHSLAENVTRVFLLTGSPILNHVDDLWSLLHMINPREFGSYYWFVNNYCVYGGYKDKQVIGVKNELELNAKLNTVMIRRLKKDVLDLPEVQYTIRAVGMHPRQQKLYDQVINDMQLTRNEDDEPDDVDNPLSKFTRLKQICGTTATVLDSKEDYSEKLSAAVWDAVQLVKDGERVVCFTQYRPVQEAYVNRLMNEFNQSKNRPQPGQWGKLREPNPVFVLNGDVDPNDRQRIVDEWSNHELPGVIVCIYSVAGTGLNMTKARYGQMLDKLFNPPLNQQAVDRMHRIGADKSQPVQILDYRCKDTVENRVEEILQSKKKISDAIVESDPLLKQAISQALKEEKERLGK